MAEYINFGIDLGTTNSCVAQAAGGEVRVIQNNDQMNVTPSVVRVLKSGSLMVGRRAYNALAEDPENVALEVKRLMGQRYSKTFPASGRVMTPRIWWRVVCGLFETAAIFSPTSRFRSVDLPAFGRPTKAT